MSVLRRQHINTPIRQHNNDATQYLPPPTHQLAAKATSGSPGLWQYSGSTVPYGVACRYSSRNRNCGSPTDEKSTQYTSTKQQSNHCTSDGRNDPHLCVDTPSTRGRNSLHCQHDRTQGDDDRE